MLHKRHDRQYTTAHLLLALSSKASFRKLRNASEQAKGLTRLFFAEIVRMSVAALHTLQGNSYKQLGSCSVPLLKSSLYAELLQVRSIKQGRYI